MVKKTLKSKFIAFYLIFSFLLLITTEVTPNKVDLDTNKEFRPVVRVKEAQEEIPASQKGRFETLIEEGKRLFQEEMDYEGAIRKFKQAQYFAIKKAQKADAFFYLSLVYYATAAEKGTEEFEQAIRKLIELDYYRELDKRLCPPKYIELFQEIKKEYGTLKIQSKPAGADVYLNDNKVPAGKTPLTIASKAGSVKIRVKKGNKEKKDILRVIAGKETASSIFVLKGGSSFLLIIGGLVLAGGGAAALLAGKKGNGGGNGDPGTGSIQVNSTPTGAMVYLDGNMKRYTNCTLTDISPGSHSVKLVKEGYKDHQESVSVTAEQTTTVNANLIKITITTPNITSSTTWTTGKEVEIKWETSASAGLQGNVSSGAGLNSVLHPRRNLLSSLRRRALRQKHSFRNLMNRRGEQESTGSAKAGGITSNGSPNFQGVSTKFSSYSKEGRNSLQRIKNIGINKKNNNFRNIDLTVAPTISPHKFGSLGDLKVLGLTDVKIQLYKGTSLVSTPASSTKNDGSYMWTVPSSLAGGTDYKVRISCVSDPNVYGESEAFTIKAISITVTKPTSSTVWYKGQSADITWTSKGTINYVKIQLYKGTTLKKTIDSSESNDGSFTWSTVDPSLANGTDYKVRIISTSDSDIYGESAKFKIESAAAITVTKPTSSTVWYKGQSADITWTSQGTISKVKIYLYKGTTLKKTIDSYETNDGSFTWSKVDTSLADGTDYKVRISNYSNSNQYGESAQFKIYSHITVTKPTSSTVWKQDESADITWTSKGTIDNVKIELYKGTTLKNTIIQTTANNGSHTWSKVDVSLTYGTDYKVRISSTADSSKYGESASFTIGEKGITVTKPTSSTVWYKGQSAAITWTSSGVGSYVKIQLYKGSILKNTIDSYDSNDGSFTWSKVDTSLADGTDYKVRISDYYNAATYGESAQFKIESHITVTKPTSSTVWKQDESADITWTSKGTIDNVKIELYKGTTLKNTIIQTTANNGSHTWSKVDASLTYGTDYKVRISSTADSSKYGESASFTIGEKQITVTKPTSSTVWTKGQSAAITWTSEGVGSYVKIQLYKGITLKNTIISLTSDDGSYTWSKVDASLADGTDYKVRISDYYTSSLYGESAQFKIESLITVTKPTSSTVWTKDQSAAITWTSKGTIDNVKIQLYKGTTLKKTIILTTPNNGSFTWSKVDKSLADGTDYKVRITSTSNSNLYGESAQFKIEPPITVTAPTSSTEWIKGASASITWTSKGTIDNVKIQLYKGTFFQKTIILTTPNNGSYTWSTVDTSLADDTNYKVRITSTTDPNLYAESAFFTIGKPGITVTGPTSSIVWYKGGNAEITWTSKGTISYVKIELYKEDVWVKTIISSTTNDSYYKWYTVDTSLASGTDYKVRITSTSDTSLYGESANFEISSGSITVTKPTSSTEWIKGASASITWTSKGTISSVIIDLYKGTTNVKTIDPSEPNNGSYTWSTVDTSLADGTDYKVRITSTTDSNLYDESAQFKIAPPSITVTEPTSSTVWGKGGSAEITWTSKGAISSVKLDLYKGTGTTPVKTITSSTSNDGSYWYTVDTSLADGTDYKVRITSTSDSNLYDDSAQFKIGPPTITVTKPTSSTVWVKGQSAAITWTSIGASSRVTIRLYKGTTYYYSIDSSESNDGSYSWSTVSTTLPDGTDYKVKITDYYNSNLFAYSAEFQIKSSSAISTKNAR